MTAATGSMRKVWPLRQTSFRQAAPGLAPGGRQQLTVAPDAGVSLTRRSRWVMSERAGDGRDVTQARCKTTLVLLLTMLLPRLKVSLRSDTQRCCSSANPA
jgi:hypothetical protein